MNKMLYSISEGIEIKSIFNYLILLLDNTLLYVLIIKYLNQTLKCR